MEKMVTPAVETQADADAMAPLWRPTQERIDRAPITRFRRWLSQHRGLEFDDYESLWRWSVTELEAFWQAIADFAEVRFHSPPGRILSQRKMPGARWFEGATLNYAEHLLRRARAADGATRPAIVFRNEAGDRREITWKALAGQAGAIARTLRSLGVVPGDRVVAYMPNIPETVAAFLGASAAGAVWSSCAPDLGPTSVIDRFRQITPKVMFAKSENVTVVVWLGLMTSIGCDLRIGPPLNWITSVTGTCVSWNSPEFATLTRNCS